MSEESLVSWFGFIHVILINGSRRRTSPIQVQYASRTVDLLLSGHFLWLIHTARNREWHRDREMMCSYIMLCSVHTTQGQGQVQGNIIFYCAHPVPCPCPSPGPMQCVWAISLNFTIKMCPFNMRVWCFNTKGGRCVFYLLIKDGKNCNLTYSLRFLSHQAKAKKKKIKGKIKGKTNTKGNFCFQFRFRWVWMGL